jgi:hypothetical protein
VHVTPATAAATSNDHLFAVFQYFPEESPRVHIVHFRATRHINDQVLAIATVHLLPGAIDTILCEQTRFVKHAQQTISMRRSTHNYVAATTTVTPVRAALWDMRFTTEATAAIATASCAHLGRCRIYKGSGFHRFCPSTNSEKLLSHFGEGLHCHDLAVLLELNNAVNQRKEREIATAANICTRCKLRATLADDNRSGGDNLTGVTLDTETLRIAVAAITSATCHDSLSFPEIKQWI